MKTWLHIVARTKTIPKDFVCGEDCEQRSIYGSLFDGHPLNHVKSEDINDEKTDQVIFGVLRCYQKKCKKAAPIYQAKYLTLFDDDTKV